MTVLHIEIAYSPTVANYNALESPLFSQNLLQVAVITATRVTINTLISTHHLSHLTLLNKRLKSREVGFPKIAFRKILYIEGVTIPFRPGMNSKVLGTGQQFLVFFILLSL